MVVRWIEGFELNGQDYNLARKVRNLTGNVAIDGGYLTGSALFSSSATFLSPALPAGDVWVVNWWWRFTSINHGAQNAAVELQLDGDDQLTVTPRAYTATTGDDRYFVDIKRGVTTLASAGPFWADEWHSFQLKATIDTVSGAYELLVDGVSEASATGVNTAAEGVANADSVYISLDNGSTSMYIDHIVVADDTGGENDDFLGETLVQAALPISDGVDTDWLPSSGSAHFSLVNEAGSGVTQETEDTKRVRAYVTSSDDLYSFTNLATALGLPSTQEVLAVCLETVARMDNSGTRTLEMRYRHSGGSDDLSAGWLVDDTTYETQAHVWDSDPVAAATWTFALLAAGQFGVRLQA